MITLWNEGTGPLCWMGFFTANWDSWLMIMTSKETVLSSCLPSEWENGGVCKEWASRREGSWGESERISQTVEQSRAQPAPASCLLPVNAEQTPAPERCTLRHSLIFPMFYQNLFYCNIIAEPIVCCCCSCHCCRSVIGGHRSVCSQLCKGTPAWAATAALLQPGQVRCQWRPLWDDFLIVTPLLHLEICMFICSTHMLMYHALIYHIPRLPYIYIYI